MWHGNHNGFGPPIAPFPNHLTVEEECPAALLNAQSLPGQSSHFLQQVSLPHMQQHYDGSPGESFQPEVSLCNEAAFKQSQMSQTVPRFSPPSAQPTTPTARSTIAINDKTAKLKAQLMAKLGKAKADRAHSATLTVTNSALDNTPTTAAAADPSNMSRRPSQTPNVTSERQEQSLDELISQHSEPKPAPAASVKKEPTNLDTSGAQKLPLHIDAKSRAPSLASPTIAADPASHVAPNKVTQPARNINGKSIGKRHSNGSMSEGEILEDEAKPTPRRSLLGISKEAQPSGNATKLEDQVARKSVDERADKPASLSRPSREDSPAHRRPAPTPKSQPQRNDRDDHRDDSVARPERQGYETYKPNYDNERKAYSEGEKSAAAYPRRDSNREEETRRVGVVEHRRGDGPGRQTREVKLPTLDDLLPLDEDLREWLEITGYHNAPYRSKILDRRRAIAALDAKRDQLLAEMEAEERGGPPVSAGAQVHTSPMLPPPIPNKAGGRVELSQSATAGAVSNPLYRIASHKRPYSEVQELKGEPIGGKYARTDARAYPVQRVHVEENLERRPRPSDLDRRERDESRPQYRTAGRSRSRSRSRERDSSPGRDGRRVWDNRSPSRAYESGNMYDRDDAPERTPRPYQVRGNYKGYAYDPSFRGQGRGRGRGRGDIRDANSGPETRSESEIGQTIATRKPFKDPQGFDRGDRGDTRYFIVKSFNEENVLKSMADGVWTTQVQNGSIFQEAFETCKNVILVFSINKSRAFQGYARMESIPGSVEPPRWQRSIAWESAGAFQVRWIVICSTSFRRIGHLKNALNEGLAVLIGKDGQEIDEACGSNLITLIEEEADAAMGMYNRGEERFHGAH